MHGHHLEGNTMEVLYTVFVIVYTITAIIALIVAAVVLVIAVKDMLE